MFDKIKIGSNGEKIALRYLKKQGYKLLEKNYRKLRCEIDLIMYDKNTNYLVFVEVKTRSGDTYGSGAEAVTNLKQENIIKATTVYLRENNYFNEQIRFDVVEVNAENKNVKHIISAFTL